ncbi:hypothetical protein HDU99_006608, partial [Rhizoclosmatium hyalinum]
MAGYVTNNGKTLQVQSGSGGQVSSYCAPVDTSFSAQLTNDQSLEASLGFSHLRINKNQIQVDWITSSGTLVGSLSVPARVPVTGVVPDKTYLTSPTDA